MRTGRGLAQRPEPRRQDLVWPARRRVCGPGGAPNTPDPFPPVGVGAPAGSVFFFESRTWHQWGVSISDKPRYSLTTLWQQHWVKPMDNIVENLHDPVYASLSEAELQLLGFKAEPSGRVEARSPGSRQNTNRKTPYVPELRRGSDARAVALDGMGDRKGADDEAKAMGLNTKH